MLRNLAAVRGFRDPSTDPLIVCPLHFSKQSRKRKINLFSPADIQPDSRSGEKVEVAVLKQPSPFVIRVHHHDVASRQFVVFEATVNDVKLVAGLPYFRPTDRLEGCDETVRQW